MKEYEFKKAWVTRSFKRAVLQPTDAEKVRGIIDANAGQATINMAIQEFPKTFWKAMLHEANLPTGLRTAISLFVFGMREGSCDLGTMYDLEVESPVEFGNSLQLSSGKANAELHLNGRWYPVILAASFVESQEKVTYAVRLECTIMLGDRTFSLSDYVGREAFVDKTGKVTPRKVRDVLESFNYRVLQTSPAEFNLRLVRAERLASDVGRVTDVSNSVIAPDRYSWWRGFQVQSLGSTEMPSRCIVDAALEAQDDSSHGYGYYGRQESLSQSHLPFVRVFSLETKSYVYADVDDITEYEFDTDALQRLHLPHDMHSILSRVFQTPIEKMFGDLLKGKHGGVVVLACGSPGVGKTLTAEIYAESTERPLYVLELGELGTSAADVEENLQRVFARVTRWNAVLQFDECEIFLSKRGTELERSAIVGIFLRLLDYYRGLLFLTTNRAEVLDDAVLSRIMLRLEYPDLDSETRANIWRTMFEIAGLNLQDYEFAELGKYDLNGRQIRNITRLAKILNPEGILNRESIHEALRFGASKLPAE